MAKIKIFDRELYYDTTDDGIYELRPDGTYQKTHSGGAALVTDGALALKVTVSGGYTYLGEAVPPGTTYANRAAHEAAAVWRCSRMDGSGNTVWADGNGAFDNVATDLTALTYP